MTAPANPLPPATAALMRALLIDHSIKATFLLLNMSLSGVAVTRAQVKNARNSALRDARDARADDAARAPAAAQPPAPAPVPQPRRPLSFDEQMARVKAGARLVAKPSFSKPLPDVTLGGVASGML